MTTATRNEVRIIGGTWRGRKLRFPPGIPGLRPTPDRVRETLFNWLRDDVPGGRCLDLYAGSGALGFEALSRGAREVVFVDQESRVCRYLIETLARLGSANGRVLCADAQSFLNADHAPFDVIFLDPPYAAGALPAVLALIDARHVLRAGGLVYVEVSAREDAPALPDGWSLYRSKRAGEVGYHLARAPQPGAPPAQQPSAGDSPA